MAAIMPEVSFLLPVYNAELFLAEFEGEAIAGLILFVFGSTAWYMYGASSNRERRRMPNYLLQWEAIRWARKRGCTLYDLWGAPDDLNTFLAMVNNMPKNGTFSAFSIGQVLMSSSA